MAARLSAITCLRAGVLAALAFFLFWSAAHAAGALRVGVQLEPPNLDPTSGAAAAIDEIVYGNVFEGLTRILEDGTPAPALAESWTVSADGLVYDFVLRRNVQFHDGTGFDADDVVFTLDRARAPSSSNAQRPIAMLIDSVAARAPDRVRIALKEPLANLPVYLGWGDFVIVAPESAETNAVNPVGTGPFRFQRWRKGASLTLIRNEDYWGARSALDQIDFVFIPDPTAAFAALMAGDVDGFPAYPAPENLRALARDDRFNIIYGTGEGEMILAINNAAPPFDDIRVRRALNHAIDKQAIIDAALFGYGTPIGSHFPPHHPSYTDLSARYPHDPSRARALLAQAGFPDGFSTTLALPPPSYARRSGEVVAAQLEAIGINVAIRNVEWAQWLDQVFANKAYDLTIVAHTEPLDIDIYAREDYYFQYRNEAFNAVIAELRRETDPARRDALYKDAQGMLAEDAVNVFLAQGPRIGVWNRDVAGVWADAPLQANVFTETDVAGRESMAAQQERRGGGPGLAVLFLVGAGLVGGAVYAMRLSTAYIASRVAAMALSLLAASLVVFILIDIAPGDPAAFMMGVNADPASIAALRAELGLDAPAPLRYLDWLGGMARGDFGVSYTYREPVGGLIAERLWVSLPLALMAFAVSTLIGVPAGLYAAARRRRAGGRAVMTAAQAGVAIPNFWLAILLVMIFAVSLRWFTAGGFPGWDASAGGGVGAALKALLLPALALALPQAAILTQIMRSATIETLREDYIRTARAKGVSRGAVLRRHALRNAMIPVLTILGLQFAFLIAGAVIIENVFYLPGLGRLVFQSIAQRDLIVVKSVVMVLVFTVILIAFLIDIAYAAVDPRLRNRHQGAGA